MKITELKYKVLGFFYRKSNLNKKISQMMVVGYKKGSGYKKVLRYAKKEMISGVIFYKKNIENQQQISKVTGELNKKSNSKYPLFMMLDQEGGNVSRINTDNDFKFYPSAKAIASEKTYIEAFEIYSEMAESIASVGFNFNLAPCVDVEIYDGSLVARQHRVYGSDASVVAEYAKQFVISHNKNKVLTALKHYPGLGSAELDPHFQLIDITETWSSKELVPFKKIIEDFPSQPVMVGHALNKTIDSENISSLSKGTIDILTNDLGHKGIVVMDAADMQGLNVNGLDDLIVKGINAGVDVFIFPNNISYRSEAYVSPDTFCYIVRKAISEGKITIEQINNSYEKITTIKRWLHDA